MFPAEMTGKSRGYFPHGLFTGAKRPQDQDNWGGWSIFLADESGRESLVTGIFAQKASMMLTGE